MKLSPPRRPRGRGQSKGACRKGDGKGEASKEKEGKGEASKEGKGEGKGAWGCGLKGRGLGEDGAVFFGVLHTPKESGLKSKSGRALGNGGLGGRGEEQRWCDSEGLGQRLAASP